MSSFRIRLLPVEKVTLVYILLTAVYLAVFSDRLDSPLTHFGIRAVVVVLILLLAVYETRQGSVIAFIRNFLPFALLSYWYPETYYFNDFIFSNLDHIFVAADQKLFGCQPSLEFSKYLPQAWFSEIMYFGYFSYYFIFFGAALWCYFVRKDIAGKAVFLFICSFYLFYIIFIVLPVIGPQFYFAPPLNEVPDGYFFCKVQRFLQHMGEKPTGAFPSSHVGITFTVVIFVSRHCRKLLKFVLPLFFILALSTVYIKAHYAVDVVGGFLAVGITYPLTSLIYRKMM